MTAILIEFLVGLALIGTALNDGAGEKRTVSVNATRLVLGLILIALSFFDVAII